MKLKSRRLFMIAAIMLATTLIISCRQTATQPGMGKILDVKNLVPQSFSISAETDTTIRGASGTILRIYKNTFVNSSGQPAKGVINIELKEAIIPASIVMAGLATRSDGKLLQTGGMVYVNATANGEQLAIAKDKIIGVAMPAREADKGMSVFTGKMDSAGLNWIDPKPILNEKIAALSEKEPHVADSSVPGNLKSGLMESEIDAIFEYTDSNKGSIDTADMTNLLVKVKSGSGNSGAEQRFVSEIVEKGQNYFKVDGNACYIFSLKNLGWANIDRLFNDPRNKEIDLITEIQNQKEYKDVSITMTISQCYIPGYQKRDNTYGFSHGDDEQPFLPVGEHAIILSTAEKDGKMYYSLKKITIEEKAKIILEMAEITKDQLEVILKEQL